MHSSHSIEEHRPWGYYQVLAVDADHSVKRIVVYPGKRLSLQSHARRAEHWHVVSGNALATLDDRFIRLASGESVDIPLRAKHRMENTGSANLVFIEVQRGDYFGEDDIVRYEDDFGRIWGMKSEMYSVKFRMESRSPVGDSFSF